MREYLKEARLKRSLTMQDVADSFGISRQYYEMIESGERQRKMDITLIAKISDLFGIPMETVIENERAIYEKEEKKNHAKESNRTENARAHHVGDHLGGDAAAVHDAEGTCAAHRQE